MPEPYENRPAIDSIRSERELRRWAWRKPEPEACAGACGLQHTGGKFTILDRIAHSPETGETVWPGDKRTGPASSFDWHSAHLTLETVITESYKNTQNVRRFFRAHAGPGFKFNMAFMNRMRTSAGKTLADTVAEYKRQRADKS